MGNGVHLVPCQQPVRSRVTVAVIYNSPNNTRIENAEVAQHSARNNFYPFTPDSNPKHLPLQPSAAFLRTALTTSMVRKALLSQRPTLISPAHANAMPQANVAYTE